MKRIVLKGALSMVFLSLCFGAAAGFQENSRDEQQKEQARPTHEVTVTAYRIETSLSETASSVTVISRSDLERTGKVTVIEALADVLGLSFTQNGPPGSAASALVRGANAEHTKVMIDGLELNDPVTPGRTFDLGLLLVESVERIEIARGPQSTLYGSDAMGGVIHIVTRQEQGPPRFRFSTSAGSFGTFSGNADLSGRSGKVAYSLATATLVSRGFSAAGGGYEGNTEADGARNLTVSGKLEYNVGEALGLHLNLRTIRSRLEIDNFGGAFGDDPNNVERYDALVISVGARGLFVRNRWESKLNVSSLEYDRNYENPVDELHPLDSDRSSYKSGLFKLDWQNNVFAHETNTLTAGLEYTREHGKSSYFSESEWGPYESLFPRRIADAVGFYLQDRISLGGRFFAAVGGRYDLHSRGGGALTFRVAPGAYFAETGTRVKATLGSGFKSPSLYQLFAPETLFGPVGNEDLEPETSLAWDAGIEQEFLGGRVTLGALYFSSSFENLIDYDFVDGYVNIGKASTRGAEFHLTWRPSNGLNFKAGYTLTEAEDETSGEPLLRRPRHKLSAALSVALSGKGRLSAEAIHLGKREDLFWAGAEPERVILSACTLVNAVASYRLGPHFQIFARLDNLLNAKYELVKGYGTPGFSVSGGLRVDY